jgi:hypothetical protein
MLSRWSAILCGAAVGLATFFVVMTVWLVMVADGRDLFIRDLDWFILGTALFAAVITGYVAGYVEDWRGAGFGVWNGLASWGLIIIVASMFVLPNFLRPLTESHTASGFLQSLDFQMMVVVCCSFGGGLILAGIAGSIGAIARRPRSLYRMTEDDELQFLQDLGTIGARRSSADIRSGA